MFISQHIQENGEKTLEILTKGRRSWALEKATPFSIFLKYMGVSKNRGTPKSSILIGCFIINRPFWGTPYFWKHPHGFWIYFGYLMSIPCICSKVYVTACMFSNHRPEWCQFPRGPKQLPCDLNKSLKQVVWENGKKRPNKNTPILIYFSCPSFVFTF